MNFILADFHLLRPLWLLAIIPAIGLFMLIRHARSHASRWDKAIDSSLLPYLLDSQSGKGQRWPLFILLAAWLLSSLSLAGPVWEKLPQPVQKKEDALVVIQDLSLSFFVRDISPSRLTRTRYKLLDILHQRREGTTALIVYAGDAHLVAPLTDDTGTIAAMVDDLSPSIMPSYGSNLPDAVRLALRLFKDSGVGSGKLLLLTDEVVVADVGKVAKLLGDKDIILSILGVGTEDGAPIPKSDGGFLQDEQGKIIVPRLNRAVLQDLAAKHGGRYSDLQLDDSDIDYLLAAQSLVPQEEHYRQVDREFDQWLEQGHWLVLLVLPFALLAFRKGWIIGLVMIMLLSSNEAQAMEWQDLWLRKDQQAAKALADNDPGKAAGLFKTPRWQGVAEFQAGNYAGAAEVLNKLGGADDHYNRGNALARNGQLEEAMQAYEKALQLNPEMDDARFNRELIENLKQQQEQQQEKGGEGQEQDQENNEAGQDQQSNDQSQEQQGENQQGESQQQGENQQQQDTSQGEDEQTDQQQKPDPTDDGDAGQQGDKDEQSRAAEQPGEEESDDQIPAGSTPLSAGELTAEQQQTLDQLLRKIPDNPGGFLRRKFKYQSSQNRDQRPSRSKKIW